MEFTQLDPVEDGEYDVLVACLRPQTSTVGSGLHVVMETDKIAFGASDAERLV